MTDRDHIGDANEKVGEPPLALSIRQPWVWAIMNAGKGIENRNWSTNFRGRVCLHAAKGCTVAEYEDAAGFIEFACNLTVPPLAELESGVIVGTARIIDCVSESDSRWFFGRYGFVLAEVTPLPFMPITGALGFFKWRGREPKPAALQQQEMFS